MLQGITLSLLFKQITSLRFIFLMGFAAEYGSWWSFVSVVLCKCKCVCVYAPHPKMQHLLMLVLASCVCLSDRSYMLLGHARYLFEESPESKLV